MTTQTTPTERKSELLDRIEAAAFLRLSPATLANWHSTQRMKIPCHKLGKRVFYRETDLQKWLELQAVNPII
ncbi:MAG: helix-turn-helix domain-containing protein [Victivallales bacterium]